MAYAYYQGQEVPSLDYFKKMLALETDATARRELEAIIAQLEKIVSEKEREASSAKLTLHNISLS